MLIRARAFSRFSVIVVLSQVFSLLRELNDLSHELVPTGRVNSNSKMDRIFGKNTSLHSSAASLRLEGS